MRRIVIISLAVILVLTFAFAGKPNTVYSQGFGLAWESSFQVQNLGTADASILMYYYDQNGNLATMDTDPDTGSAYANPDSDTVGVGESNTYYPIHAASGFNGSVVVSSSEPIAVISQVMVTTGAKSYGSYVGFQQGATTIYFPILQKNNGTSKNTSTFNVQNTGSTAVDYTIHFVPAPGGGYATPADITETGVAVGASKSYNLEDRPEFSAMAKWVGSATVTVVDTANDSIAGVANMIAKQYEPNAYQLSTYNAFTGGSTTVVLPLIQENNSGNRTSINCQNIHPSTTTEVTVTYTPETGSAAKTPQVISGVDPNEAAIVVQDYQGTTKFVGSAVVTSNPAVPMVCVVNIQKPSVARASSYEGFDPASATDKVVLPLIQSRNGNATKGWAYTTINLATGDGAAHAVTCNFVPGEGFGDPTDQSGNAASLVFVQNDVFGTGAQYLGGAECEVTDATGVGLFAIVNQQRYPVPEALRDVLTSYDGFNVTP